MFDWLNRMYEIGLDLNVKKVKLDKVNFYATVNLLYTQLLEKLTF